MQNLKGWRTVGIGFLIAVGPAALQYLGAVDWSHLLPPWAAFLVSGAVMVAMRFPTNTGLGQSS